MYTNRKPKPLITLFLCIATGFSRKVYFRFSFSSNVCDVIGLSPAEHGGGAECGVLRRSGLYGYASEHYDKRPLHSGDATVWWLPGYQHTTVADVDAVHVDGALRLPKYADSGV